MKWNPIKAVLDWKDARDDAVARTVASEKAHVAAQKGQVLELQRRYDLERTAATREWRDFSREYPNIASLLAAMHADAYGKRDLTTSLVSARRGTLRGHVGGHVGAHEHKGDIITEGAAGLGAGHAIGSWFD